MCHIQNDVHRGFNNEYLLAHMGVILNTSTAMCLTLVLAIIIIFPENMKMLLLKSATLCTQMLNNTQFKASNRDETYTQESERKRERIARRLTRYLNKTSKIYVAAKEHFLVK